MNPLLASLAALALTCPLIAQPPTSSEPATPIVDGLVAQSKALLPLVKSEAVKCFLNSTSKLPEPKPRTIWRNRDKHLAYNEIEYDKLDEKQREGLTKRDCTADFFYSTGYGSPLMYARPLDIYATAAGLKTFSRYDIADFGYGTIGHLRLLALQGARTIGIDVEPLFRALYSLRGDAGDIFPNPDCVSVPNIGRIDIVTGRWPAEKPVADQVAALIAHELWEGAPANMPRGLDLFISKNTLKRGYIHPARPVDEKFLVKLGVDDAMYCRAVFDSLKPGGFFLIYNLSPAQAPEGKPYLPHADGQCPFERPLLEKTGFQVIEFDKEDRDTALDFWMALGFNADKSREETHKDLFAWYTLCRRPTAAPAPATTPKSNP